MVKPIPLEDAFDDSPAFRLRLQASEGSMNDVDQSIKKMAHIAEKLGEVTKEYSTRYSQLAEEIQTLAGADDDPAYETVGQQLLKFAQVIKDIERSRAIAASQLKDVFIQPLSVFAAKEIHPAKKAGREFQNAQDQYQAALSKYMSKKPTDKGLEESARDVAEARKSFHLKTLDYGAKLNDLDMKRKFEMVENVVALVYANFSFFHQAYDALKDLEPSMRDLTAMLQKMRSDYSKVDTKASTESIVRSVAPESYDPASGSGTRALKTPSSIYKGGYLFKKSSSKMRTVWNRRYFELINNYLHYFSMEGKDEAKTAIDLRICMVKETPGAERRFCFDLISPNKVVTLQAENDDQLKDWMSVLQAAISRSISDEGFDSTPLRPTYGDIDQSQIIEKHKPINELLQQIRDNPENQRCADCDSDEDVEWASCNMGVVLCITCSGIHRGLGRHVSKVKSLVLDRWDQESGDIMLLLGNERANAILEKKLRIAQSSVTLKPKPNSERSQKQQYCSAKYTHKEFLGDYAAEDSLSQTPLQSEFANAIKGRELLAAYCCIMHGANVNEKDLTGQTPLHLAVDHPDALMVEFLLTWNADPNIQDGHGRTPLHTAADKGNADAVLALLRRNARTDIHDNSGKLAVDIAVEKSDAGGGFARTLTALQLTKLDSDFRSSQHWKAKGGEPFTEAVHKTPGDTSWSKDDATTSTLTAPSASDPWAEETTVWTT
ncbi:Arf-GAP with coiled-coil, ANK repeat and PH domain-containing protein 2 [Gaertneriomyces sp. JEL0708]|nr:Arf-GAP with coiled-coil, ANK repeat and PH domain-containing protein 2 [Gaertneriomyces sp. JEL0708]